MIIKVIGLSLLAMFMFGIGYFCGWIMTAIKYEVGGVDHERDSVYEDNYI